MYREKFALVVLMSGLLFTTSCGQGEESVKPTEESTEESVPTPGYSNVHQYGGWYCPDNFGFPPVDIQELDQIPVVADRLPTMEETRNGTSLMYFDKTKIPDASPLAMDLPRVATIKNQHTGLKELIIVIQAVVAGTDTVVGYRFPDGGNGSAWYGQVDFLSDAEVDALGSRPMVYEKIKINASREEIWRAFTTTDYAKELGEKFDQKEFFESDWSSDTGASLELETDKVSARGGVWIHYGNLYLHVNYDYDGFHYSEKMLMLEQPDVDGIELHFAAGPFSEGIHEQESRWEKWIQEVKRVSEHE